MQIEVKQKTNSVPNRAAGQQGFSLKHSHKLYCSRFSNHDCTVAEQRVKRWRMPTANERAASEVTEQKAGQQAQGLVMDIFL